MGKIDRRTFLVAAATITTVAGCLAPDPTDGYGRGAYGFGGYGR